MEVSLKRGDHKIIVMSKDEKVLHSEDVRLPGIKTLKITLNPEVSVFVEMTGNLKEHVTLMIDGKTVKCGRINLLPGDHILTAFLENEEIIRRYFKVPETTEITLDVSGAPIEKAWMNTDGKKITVQWEMGEGIKPEAFLVKWPGGETKTKELSATIPFTDEGMKIEIYPIYTGQIMGKPKALVKPETKVIFPTLPSLVKSPELKIGEIKGAKRWEILLNDQKVQSVILREGKNLLKIIAYDALGLPHEKIYEVLLDTSPPEVFVNWEFSKDGLTISATTNEYASLELSYDEKVLPFSTSITLEDTPRKVLIKAVDLAGNITEKEVFLIKKPRVKVIVNGPGILNITVEGEKFIKTYRAKVVTDEGEFDLIIKSGTNTLHLPPAVNYRIFVYPNLRGGESLGTWGYAIWEGVSEIFGEPKEISGKLLLKKNLSLKNVKVIGKATIYAAKGSFLQLEGDLNGLKIVGLEGWEGAIVAHSARNFVIEGGEIGVRLKEDAILQDVILKGQKVAILLSGNAKIKHTSIENCSLGISGNGGTVDMEGLTLGDCEVGIEIKNGEAFFKKITIKHGKVGIRFWKSSGTLEGMSLQSLEKALVFSHADITLVRSEIKDSIYGIDLYKSSISILNSNVEGCWNGLRIYDAPAPSWIYSSTFKGNDLDINLESSSNVYVKGVSYEEVIDGKSESPWIDELGRKRERGKVVEK